MKPTRRHQLVHLDQAILALLNERARLLSIEPEDDPGRMAPIDDLLRRNTGPFAADDVGAVFAAVDAGCSAVTRGSDPFRSTP
jgi:hypothetical protein